MHYVLQTILSAVQTITFMYISTVISSAVCQISDSQSVSHHPHSTSLLNCLRRLLGLPCSLPVLWTAPSSVAVVRRLGQLSYELVEFSTPALFLVEAFMEFFPMYLLNTMSTLVTEPWNIPNTWTPQHNRRMSGSWLASQDRGISLNHNTRFGVFRWLESIYPCQLSLPSAGQP